VVLDVKDVWSMSRQLIAKAFNARIEKMRNSFFIWENIEKILEILIDDYMFGLWLCQRPTSWGSAMPIQVWALHSPCGRFT
jgi:hypothetical protein